MEIVIERGKIVELESLPNYSIALDGFVQGPKIDAENHRYSFDHHSGCLRYCTTAACMQALNAVQLGLDPEKYTVYANDIDSDVAMAIWCLKNPNRCNEPLAIKLVNAVGIGDMFLGGIPINGMFKVVEYISEPETNSKRNQDYYKLSNDGLKSILEAVLHRIDSYVDGESQIEVAKQKKDSDYKILRNEHGYVVVESSNPHIYSYLYQSGFDKIVLIRRQDDGSNAVSLAKRSDFIENFDIPKICCELNKLESGWGCGSTVGGAPRNSDGSRSRLPLEKIYETIDNTINDFIQI